MASKGQRSAGVRTCRQSLMFWPSAAEDQLLSWEQRSADIILKAPPSGGFCSKRKKPTHVSRGSPAEDGNTPTCLQHISSTSFCGGKCSPAADVVVNTYFHKPRWFGSSSVSFLVFPMAAAAPLPTWKQAPLTNRGAAHSVSELQSSGLCQPSCKHAPMWPLSICLPVDMGQEKEQRLKVSPAAGASHLPLVLPSAAAHSPQPLTHQSS